jgi:hemerythrin-like domain-containing protein
MESRYIDPCPLKPLCPTSNIIKPVNGDYDFANQALLVPHEAVRLMTERTSLALAFYNPEVNPWKLDRLRTWFEKCYVPMIHEHHDAEEKIFFPSYQKLGVTDFDNQTRDHVELMQLLDQVQKSLEKRDGDDTRAKFQALADHMLRHLEEEEAFWPDKIRQLGEKKMQQIEQQIISSGQKHGGLAFQMMLIAICEAMGVSMTGPHPEGGWATVKIKDSFKSKLPMPVRKLLVPSWERQWRYHVDLLVSITEEKVSYVEMPAGCCGGCAVM